MQVIQASEHKTGRNRSEEKNEILLFFIKIQRAEVATVPQGMNYIYRNAFKKFRVLTLSITPYGFFMNSWKTLAPVSALLLRIIADYKDFGHGLTNNIDTKAKCRHIKKNWLVKGLCDRCLPVCRPPPLLGLCLGWSSNLVGSESGQIQSVKLMQNMVSNRTQHPPPPPSHTLFVWKGEGAESWTREKVRGTTVLKAGSKIPTW